MAAVMAADGAAFEIQAGWRIATTFAPARAEELALRQTVGWGDASHMRKLELQGTPKALDELPGNPAIGTIVEVQGGAMCRVTPTRALLLGAGPDAFGPDVHVVDVTTQFVALRIGGPQSRELIARFCALDLRPHVTPPRSFRPGSVARTPGLVLCEATDRYVLLAGAALGEYLWTVVSDAGHSLGGRPVGAKAFDAAPVEEVTHA
jgi:glycine cleavage system aminomethyltransferase T